MKQLTLGSDYSIRVANMNDWVALSNIIRRSYEESPYGGVFNGDYAFALIQEYIEADDKVILVLTHKGHIVGILAAQYNTFSSLLSGKKMVSEMIWYVHKEHRTKYSFKLIEALEFWAKELIKADGVFLSTYSSALSDRIGKIYKRLGYTPVEQTYSKEF